MYSTRRLVWQHKFSVHQIWESLNSVRSLTPWICNLDTSHRHDDCILCIVLREEKSATVPRQKQFHSETNEESFHLEDEKTFYLKSFKMHVAFRCHRNDTSDCGFSKLVLHSCYLTHFFYTQNEFPFVLALCKDPANLRPSKDFGNEICALFFFACSFKMKGLTASTLHCKETTCLQIVRSNIAAYLVLYTLLMISYDKVYLLQDEQSCMASDKCDVFVYFRRMIAWGKHLLRSECWVLDLSICQLI